LRATLLHGAEIELHLAELHAVRREFVVRLVKHLGGFEHGLRRNAARVKAGAAESMRAIEILPRIDARDLEAVLRGANRGRVTGGTATDHDHVVGLAHFFSLKTVRRETSDGRRRLARVRRRLTSDVSRLTKIRRRSESAPDPRASP